MSGLVFIVVSPIPEGGTPEFVEGDDTSVLSLEIRDMDGILIDLTAPRSTTLVAKGIDSADAPIFPGVLVGLGTAGRIDFKIGGVTTIGARKSEIYRYRVKSVSGTSELFSPVQGKFIVHRNPEA